MKMNEIKETSQENSAGEHSKMPEPLGTPQFKMPRYAKESLSLMPIEKPFDPILFPFFRHSRLDLNTPSSKEKFF